MEIRFDRVEMVLQRKNIDRETLVYTLYTNEDYLFSRGENVVESDIVPILSPNFDMW